MRVAIIPARGGSKRIPRKNIKEFRGKPMIGWSIEAAIASELFDRIVVSTDDPMIAEVATACGAEVPFTRAADLSDDYTGTAAVVADALRRLESDGARPAAACCIYATAPFIQASDIRAAHALLETGDWQYVFSATTFDFTIFRALQQNPSGGVMMVFPEHADTRSQDLPETIHDAGQFYWGRRDAWLSDARIYDTHSQVVLIPRWRAQDIDTAEDWRRAELLHRIVEETSQHGR
jgi:pseudaminic acid cytidylyltransferase